MWQATGERTAALRVYYHDARSDAGGHRLNAVAAQGPVAVDEAGRALTLMCSYEVTALDGTIVDSGAQTEVATRITP